MGRQFIAVAILLIAASAASADTLGVFVSDPGYSSVYTNHSESEWSGGIGLDWDHSWNQRWSTEASVTWDRRHVIGTVFESGLPVTNRQTVDSYPVDVMMRYRFVNDSRWTPYVSAGLHYVHAPSNEFAVPHRVINDPNGAVYPIIVQPFGDRAGLQVGVGTKFRITPRVGLQFDLKRQVRHDGIFYDPLTRGSFGVNLSF